MVDMVLMGLLAGMLVGIVPAFYGATRDQLGMGLAGFVSCAVCGAILGLLLAVPCGAVWFYAIRRHTTRRCPVCAETIPARAQTCRYCGAALAVPGAAPAHPSAAGSSVDGVRYRES